MKMFNSVKSFYFTCLKQRSAEVIWQCWTHKSKSDGPWKYPENNSCWSKIFHPNAVVTVQLCSDIKFFWYMANKYSEMWWRCENTFMESLATKH